MKVGGTLIGAAIIALTLIGVIAAIQYNSGLEARRMQNIEHLATIAPTTECRYTDETLCPQAEAVSLPQFSGGGIAALTILLGIYLIRSDRVQRRILRELEEKRKHTTEEERFSIVLSALTKEERGVVRAIRDQPGITQATLRLRADVSKAKLSALLKELERRNVVAREGSGKTNKVYLKGV